MPTHRDDFDDLDVLADRPLAQESPQPTTDEWGWTRRHQIGLAMLTFCLLVFLAVQLWRHPVRLGSAVKLSHLRHSVLERRIDLNTATWASVVRLPDVGPGRADRILEYRSRQLKLHPGTIVFRSVQDLRKVPGIGKKISRELLPFLVFPRHPTVHTSGTKQ